HGVADQADVEVEADTGDVPGLLPAQQVARTTDLQVLHRHRGAGTQVGVGRDGLQPVHRCLGERLLRRIEEVGVGTLPPSTHAATQLVQLGEAELVSPVHDEGVGVGDVQSGLDDRGAHHHVEV